MPLFSQYAGNLTCKHCGKQNSSSKWPKQGDLTPFYFQATPSRYQVTIHCPHCSKDWYVVWDSDPGPIEGVFATASDNRPPAQRRQPEIESVARTTDPTPAIRFPCPACGRALKAPPQAAGKQARCSFCKSQIPVPHVSTTPSPAPTTSDLFQGEPIAHWIDRVAGINGKEDWDAGQVLYKGLGPSHVDLIPHLISFLKTDSPEAKRRADVAAGCLGCIGRPAQAAIPSLIRLFEESKGALRDESMDALRQIMLESDEHIPLLLKASQDKRSRVRWNVAWFLKDCTGTVKKAIMAQGRYYSCFPDLLEAVRAAMAELTSGDPDIRNYADTFLKPYGTPDQALRKAYQKEYAGKTEDVAKSTAQESYFAHCYPEDETLAHRLKALMDIVYAQFRQGGEKTNQAMQSKEWDEICKIGQQLSDYGGFKRMVFVYHRMRFLRGGDDGCLSRTWDGIGSWQA